MEQDDSATQGTKPMNPTTIPVGKPTITHRTTITGAHVRAYANGCVWDLVVDGSRITSSVTIPKREEINDAP